VYVCLCKGITDRQIRHAVDAGAGSYRAVRECLGVATQCGKCGCLARDIVRNALGNRPAASTVASFTPARPAMAAAG
jgi:bacterioferritin-associated ferredoxin